MLNKIVSNIKRPKVYIPTIIVLVIIGIISILLNPPISKENNVLGIETKPKLIGTYEGNIDEYTYEYDWKYEGYTKLEPFVKKPQYSLVKDTIILVKTWGLQNGYNIEASCPDLKMQNQVPGDYQSCILKYNNTIVSNNVRYEAPNGDNIRSEGGYISFVIYSDILNKEEYLITGSYAGGSYDNISVFRLENGKATLIPFNNGKESSNEWNISYPMVLEMYEDNGKFKLITYYHDPSMGIDNNLEGIYEVWNIQQKELVKEKTIGDVEKES